MGALCALAPASAGAATWSVSPQGSDANPGSAEAPFRSVGRAAQAAGSGDSVLVASGRYPETVELPPSRSGIAFRGVGGGRPVIDGEGRRGFGFQSVGAERLTIENFEFTGQTEAGIHVRGARNTVVGNLIHHVGSPAQTHSNGIRVARASDNRVAQNTIHHIGPGAESMGIWLVEARDSLVEDNVVYLVRKEGIRDWKGLDNSVTGNRVFLNWVGISLGTSTGSLVTDNHVHDNVEGVTVKHASYDTVLDHWGLGVGRWTRVGHNSVHRSTEASIWIAQSDAPLDYLEVRGNRFSGAGAAFIRDRPSLRGPNVVLDGNAYSDDGGRPRWLYKAGWGSAPGLTDWAAVRILTGWETNAPPRDAGARGSHSSPVGWTPHAMTPVDSSSKGTNHTNTQLDKTADNDQSSYWMTAGNQNEYVTFDFGEPRTFDHLILTLLSHDDPRNPRGYRFDVSADGRDWQTVSEGTNPDPAHPAHFYELARPATGRYLRFTMVDTFCESYAPRAGCGENFVLSDLRAGLLAGSAGSLPLGDSGGQAGAPGPADGPGSGPRARLRVARTAVLARGWLRLTVGSARSTRGRDRVTLVGTCKRAGRTRTVLLGRARVAVEPGRRMRVRVRLKKAALRQLRRNELRAVHVKIRTADGAAAAKRLRIRIRG